MAKQADADTTSYVGTQLKESDVKLQIDEAAFSGKTEADMADFSEEAVKKYYGETVTAFTGMDGVDEESEKNRLTSYVQDYASISDRDEVLAGSALSGLEMCIRDRHITWQILKQKAIPNRQ